MSSSTSFGKLFSNLIAATERKLASSALKQEYSDIELTGPAPGNAWGQHDAMVSQGLCKAAQDHVELNRYCNLYPFDSHRVVLDKVSPDEIDYINASWVNLKGVNRGYVLTMAPLDPASKSTGRTWVGSDTCQSTCPEFWRMVYQAQARLIVMICKVEPGFTGCGQYFPEELNVPVRYGGRMQVEMVEENRDEEAGICQRTFRVTDRSKEGPDSSRTVRHVQFFKWPNYGVVEDVAILSNCVRLIHQVDTKLRQESETPLVVHCSGGIGRSGTFTTIYSVYLLLQEFVKRGGDKTVLGEYLGEKNPDLVLTSLVKQMREQRHPWMVEGFAQYSLAYAAIIDLMKHWE